MKNRKYTPEILKPIVESSISIAEVIRKLGLRQTGGTQSNIKRLIREFELDTSHFLGQGINKGKADPKRLSASEILTIRDPLARPEQAKRLKRALFEIGRKYECEECSLGSTWNGKPLNLQIDHINGKRYDNTDHNLRFLCPNCHTQTPTWGRTS